LTTVGRTNKILISLGANIAGKWGSPRQSLTRAVEELERCGFAILATSPLYTTEPIGGGRQPQYLNLVIEMCGSVGPAALLRILKKLEKAAGRRTRTEAAPRPLDLDIIDFGGRVLGRKGRPRPKERLILPHPEAHRRGFVLVPLADIAPGWQHPVLGRTSKQLLSRRPALRRGIQREGGLVWHTS
jgi:2-amino-4-hydroxy-6-hydroxymethyldihydropteridine diphosphokinase